VRSQEHSGDSTSGRCANGEQLTVLPVGGIDRLISALACDDLQLHVLNDDSVGLQLRQRLSCLRRQLLEDGVLGPQPDPGRIHRAAISQRTRDALVAKRVRGSDWAQRRPYQCRSPAASSPSVTTDGRSIAKGLMADGVPTARSKTADMHTGDTLRP
jgi:hypothetical protein